MSVVLYNLNCVDRVSIFGLVHTCFPFFIRLCIEAFVLVRMICHPSLYLLFQYEMVVFS